GRWFGCNHTDTAPDIMTMAKIPGGGVIPLGALMSRPEGFEPMDETPYIHSSTFGCNALACAARYAATQTLEQDGLPEQARVKGERLTAGLRQIAAQFPQVIGEVRGRGLMIGMELTREVLGGVIIADIVQNGLLAIHSLNNDRVMRFLPPAVVTEDQIDRALEIFGAAVERAAAVAEEV